MVMFETSGIKKRPFPAFLLALEHHLASQYSKLAIAATWLKDLAMNLHAQHFGIFWLVPDFKDHDLFF